MNLRSHPAPLIAIASGWFCLLIVGCQSVRGERLDLDPEPGTQAAAAPAAAPAAAAAPTAALGTPIQRASYSPSQPPDNAGPAAILGNPRIGPNSDLTWSIRDLPGAPGSLIGGRGVVDREGRIDLGVYGSVVVAGLTPTEAMSAIHDHVAKMIETAGGAVAMERGWQPIPSEPSRLAPVAQVGNATVSAAAVGTPLEWAPAGSRPAPKSPAQTDTGLRPVAYTPPATAVAQATPPRVAQPMPKGVPDGPTIEPPPAKPEPAGKPAPTPKPAATPAPAGKPMPAPPPATEAEPLPAPRAVDDPLVPIPAADHPHAPDTPRELAMTSLPPYILDPPDVLLIESTQGLRDQPIRGQHLIRPDGTVSLGIYGSAHVAGMTLEQARAAIATVLALRIKDFDPRNLSVDVLSYNSKVYYVITDGGGYGEQVYRIPVTGNETVLDAISQINGLPPVASKRKIWVARRTPGDGGTPQVYPVNWKQITQEGISATNYQVLPGDRIYVKADCLMRIDAALAKFLSPVQRVLGTTLLGASTVNTIGGGAGSGIAGTFIAR